MCAKALAKPGLETLPHPRLVLLLAAAAHEAAVGRLRRAESADIVPELADPLPGEPLACNTRGRKRR